MSANSSPAGTPKEMEPRVSIIIPAFNAEARIEAALETVLQQTMRELEVIVVNDGSYDRTASLLRRAMKKDDRIRLIEQANRGIGEARNQGLAIARGALVAFLDHDDLWHPEKLQKQADYMDAHPEFAIVACYSALIDSAGCCLGWRFGGRIEGNVYDRMLEEDLVGGGSVAMVRMQALQAVGFFDGSIPLRADWDLWLRLTQAYPFGTLRQILVGYTRTPGSTSRDYEQMAWVGAEVIEKASRGPGGFSESRRRYCVARDTFAIAGLCFIDGDNRKALKYLSRSISLSPFPLLRSARRIGVLAALILSTLLPRVVYEELFSVMSRLVFDIKPGLSFEQLCGSGLQDSGTPGIDPLLANSATLDD